MADESAETTLKSIPFSGKTEDWRKWVGRFKAYATLKGFAAALKENGETELPEKEEEVDTLDPTKAEDKKKITAVNRNGKAYSALMLAMDEDVSYAHVEGATTDNWPGGLVTNFPRDWVRDPEFWGPELFSPLSYLRSEGAYGIRNSDPMHI